jgi:hypothetical protein
MTGIVTWESTDPYTGDSYPPDNVLHGFTNTRHQVFLTEVGQKYLVSNKMIRQVEGAENVFSPTDMSMWSKFMQKMENSSNQELIEEQL